jgi:hypothetical protein
MEALPYVDEHSRRIAASPAATWAALLHVLRGLGSSTALASLLGCDPQRGTPRFEGRAGDALPGFRVVAAETGVRLALRGRHRFSDYALTFLLEEGLLRAQTHARFPGVQGRLYRAAVIGSGGHRVITRGLLRQVERASRAIKAD